MFTDATKSAIKITDWGLVKVEDLSTGNDDNNSSSSSSAINIDRKSLELTAVVSEGNIGVLLIIVLQNNGLHQLMIMID
jgi:hypothetical protein